MAKASSQGSVSKPTETKEETESKTKKTPAEKATAKKTTASSSTKKAPAKKTTAKKETAKAKSAASSKKKAEEAKAADLADMEDEETEDILESNTEPSLHEVHDDSDVKESDLTDESLLEGIPEEELKATVEIAPPKVNSKSKSKRSRSRKQAGDSSVALLTGDPVRMYLKEIGKVSLLTAAEEIDLAMKIEAGVAATEELEKAEEEGIELERRERRRLSRVEQVGLDAKQQLIEANLRLVVSIAKRYVGRGMLFLDLSRKAIWALSVLLRSLTIPRALSFLPMLLGGFVRQLPVLLLIRLVPFVFRYIWLRLSINWCVFSVNFYSRLVANLLQKKLLRRWA